MVSSAHTASPPTLEWDGSRLRVLDQTRLPAQEVVLELTGAEDTAAAIRRLSVRGAPLIGVVAGYGLAMEVSASPGLGSLEAGAALLRRARPTAVNLGWAVDRVHAAAVAAGPLRMAGAARAEAEAIHREDEAASAALARNAADWLEALLPGRGGQAPLALLTHCNTGSLAACGRGTALGVIAELADRRPARALACEARPLLQGARLTVYELSRWGIPHELLADSAAAGILRSGEVDAVVVGFDRVAANGDVVNKVGTYGLALAARAAGVPFVAAGPASSVDLHTSSGDDVEIEERDPDEVRRALGQMLTLPETACRNPAFDVTPAELVSAIVTERGVVRPDQGEDVTSVA